MEYQQLKTWLSQRLQQPLPGHQRMHSSPRTPVVTAVPATARPSAVLLLLFPVDRHLNLLLIKRTEDGHAHSGQISFPGGKQDPEDSNLMATALREAWEEVGLTKEKVSVLGQLTPLYIPVSNYHVFPFVAMTQERPAYQLSQDEVAAVLETPLLDILNPATKITTRIALPRERGLVRKVQAYRLRDGSIVWGATAMILAELEMLLEEWC